VSRICFLLEVSRSNIYEKLTPSSLGSREEKNEKDQKVLDLIRAITEKRTTYGYRRTWSLLRPQEKINHKRVYRIMKENNLLLPKFGKRPLRVHEGTVMTLKSNTRWCSDAFGIQCWNGEQLQVAFSLDTCDREVMSWVSSSRGIDGELIRDLMTDSVVKRFGPLNPIPNRIQWLSDNGPCYVARETVQFGKMLGFEMCTTAPYSPESNGMAEAFVKTFKRDYVYVSDLSSAQRVREQLAGWFKDYNENAPHKGLRMLSPKEYRRRNQQVS